MGESMVMFAADAAGPLDEVAHFTRRLAGADSNVAIGLARLDFDVVWTSRVGDDALGRFIVSALEQEGIDCGNVRVVDDRPTGFQLKSRCDDGQDPTVEYFRRDSAATTLCPADLADIAFGGIDHLHLTGITAAISESAYQACHEAVRAMRASGGTVSFDPNLRPSLWASTAQMRARVNALARAADWVLPGLDEAKVLVGSRNAEDIARFYLSAGVSEVVIKHGAQGAFWQTATASGSVRPRAVSRVVDTVGAGDGFAVGYISARLDGLTPDEAAARGAEFGARVVTRPGDFDGLPRRVEIAR
ncbi:sugar kinase [Salinisphaera sp. Q1T1-3]|uniref:sugar kinase n=1 Tax=Salinisphaera sp. Q1T1-3 TaxID=2321229 RepID=UPI000E731D75|nr:sugar kinase [Salinisphaera sp. Q1T1-3]